MIEKDTISENRMKLHTTIKLRDMKGIGVKTEAAFIRYGISTPIDLLDFFPTKYLDYTSICDISNLKQGMPCVCKLQILSNAKTIYVKGITVTTAMATDGKQKVRLSWYNQPYRSGMVYKDTVKYVFGIADVKRGKNIINPTFSDIIPGIVPVYPKITGVKSSIVKNAISEMLGNCDTFVFDYLPQKIREENRLIPLSKAYSKIHMPMTFQDIEEARKRLDFEHFLMYFLNVEVQRQERHRAIGYSFSGENSIEEYQKLIPFQLTDAQLNVILEINKDMHSPVQMNRIVQGDVGSGKTVVAMYAMYMALKNGKQVALLAPTEVLAHQHFDTVSKYFPNTILMTGSLSKTIKKDCLEKIENGTAGVVIGTHALFQSDVRFSNLALVITDEQHRFGVSQRFKMEQKGIHPDVLVMSATPIPRTLALLLYGDLDLSCIDKMPFGRKPIKTSYIPDRRRAEMYDYLYKQAKDGKQIYVVCPYIEEDEEQDIRSVQDVYKELSCRYKDISISMLHGKMKQDEKEKGMESFRRGEIGILVTTTVIEVGVDVKNAVYMVIEDADRFGLAQLHQLRGRVGRGEEQSYCFLLSNADSENAKQRIQIICSTTDGFKIAEMDLKMRGAGDFIGTRQHGDISDSFIELGMDENKIMEVKRAAKEIIDCPTIEHTEYLNIAIERYSAFRDKITMN